MNIVVSDSDGDDLDKYKKDFAYRLLKNPFDSFKAASEVFPRDRARALFIYNNWINDVDVIRYKEEHLENLGEEEFLPSKVDLLNKIWEKMHSKKIDHSDYQKFAKLYADLRGFCPKEAPQISMNIGESAKVMVVQNYGEDDDWEKAAKAQQRALLSDGS